MLDESSCSVGDSTGTRLQMSPISEPHLNTGEPAPNVLPLPERGRETEEENKFLKVTFQNNSLSTYII